MCVCGGGLGAESGYGKAHDGAGEKVESTHNNARQLQSAMQEIKLAASCLGRAFLGRCVWNYSSGRHASVSHGTEAEGAHIRSF